jgi:outer membrane protein assembly factor BamA
MFINQKTLFFFGIIILFTIISCSPTKYLEKDEFILNKVKINIDNSEFEDYDFEPYLKQKAIRKTFWIALHARIYNTVNPKKDIKREQKVQKKLDKKNARINNKFDNKTNKILKKRNSYKYAMKKALDNEDSTDYQKYDEKYEVINKTYTERLLNRDDIIKDSEKDQVFTFAGWLRKIGEEPEIFDKYLLDKSKQQFQLYLKNKGYYYADIECEDPKEFLKRVNITFNIHTNSPVVISDVNINCYDTALNSIILNDFSNSGIKNGTLLDIDILQEERTRISNLLKDKGYFNFSKQYINYTIDTSENKCIADLTLNVDKFEDLDGNISEHIKYKIGDIYIFSDYNPQLALEFPKEYFADNDTSAFFNEDSIKYNFIKKNEIIVKPSAIINDIYIFPDSIYCLSNIKASYKHLSSLKIYKLANIQLTETDSINHILECNVQLTPSKRASYTFETQATNTSANIGATQNLKFQHKNLFKGGEIFDLKLSATLESHKIRDAIDDKIKFQGFNSQEYNFETGIEFPKLLIPFKVTEFIKRNNPKTTISLGFSYQNGLDYTRTMANSNFTYNWKNSEKLSFSPSLIRLSLIRIPQMDTAFVTWLEGISATESYEDQFIIGSSFNLTFSNQKTAKRDFIFFKINTDWSGNLLYGILKTTNKFNWTNIDTVESGSFLLPVVETTFAQFFKSDIDFRYYNILDESNTLVYRFFVGAGVPFGNSNLLPFSEKYFSGGANSIRAWQVRSLGPGTIEKDTTIIIPNQTADIKLEANLEYRVKLFWILEGAFFLDIGNIWAINEYDTRPGAMFHFNSFYKELAVGSGFGARLDINFIILRFDIGVKLKDPRLSENNKWKNFENYERNDFTFNFGIGYPF